MQKFPLEISSAKKSDALVIARLIMQAMSYDCCQNFIGPNYELKDFEDLLTYLVLRDDSQYSYLNTLVAKAEGGDVVGICVSYDGAHLHQMRKAFQNSMMERFHRDFFNMDDETNEGELYIDSLAVREDSRNLGIATALLLETISKAKSLGLPKVGLLVDKGNPKAQRLYKKVGFKYINDSFWGGHPMLHLQHDV
ncbi:MAG: GNAT family N-acetyltransferase [Prevotella sp.]|nr:GNAT family N-acetyltransferase [Prevotella sp.]